MGCDYCKEDKPLIQFIQHEFNAFANQCFEENMQIIIDREHLRYCSVDDCNCLDHGEKIKINYCPMCGYKLTKEDK